MTVQNLGQIQGLDLLISYQCGEETIYEQPTTFVLVHDAGDIAMIGKTS